MSLEINLITKNHYTLKVKEGCEDEVMELLESKDGLSSTIVDMMYNNSSLTDIFNENAFSDIELIEINDETGEENSVCAIENIELE